MALRIKGKSIWNHCIVGKLLLLNNLIVHERVSLSKITDLEYLREEEDEITCEKGVVVMPCGHVIGRSAMNNFMRNMVTEKQCEIRCPFEGCNA